MFFIHTDPAKYHHLLPCKVKPASRNPLSDERLACNGRPLHCASHSIWCSQIYLCRERTFERLLLDWPLITVFTLVEGVALGPKNPNLEEGVGTQGPGRRRYLPRFEVFNCYLGPKDKPSRSSLHIRKIIVDSTSLVFCLRWYAHLLWYQVKP